MPKIIYIVTEINFNESPQEVSTAQAFSTKKSAMAYVEDIISQYQIDDDDVSINETNTNWYSEHFDIALFESNLE